MASGNQVQIVYKGTNVGKIYLSDVRQRLGLGGGQEGDYNGGQDQYIIWGETLILNKTGEVLMSWTDGVLKYFSDSTKTEWSTRNGPPLTITEGDFAKTLNDPLRDVTGSTGRYTDDYLTRLQNARYQVTGLAGATGYYYGNVL